LIVFSGIYERDSLGERSMAWVCLYSILLSDIYEKHFPLGHSFHDFTIDAVLCLLSELKILKYNCRDF